MSDKKVVFLVYWIVNMKNKFFPTKFKDGNKSQIIYCGIIFIVGVNVRGQPEFFWSWGHDFVTSKFSINFISIKQMLVYAFVGM